MFNDWRIARPFGINLYVSGWFWILPVVVFATAYSAGGMAAAVTDTAAVLALFACVGLHELGHALAARAYGIRTRDITLYPIGGVARLERMPEKPSAEIAIALAGPAVNVGIALLLGGLMLLAGAVSGPVGSLSAFHLDGFLGRLFWGNVGLVVFNLIPAFPMDGGRVLRAGLSWFTSRVNATVAAGWVGAGFAVLFALYGLGLFGGPFSPLLVFLAVSVFLMGRQEVQMVRLEEYEKRQHAMWEAEQRHGGGENGWVYDARTGEWIEYRNGWPVGRFRG